GDGAALSAELVRAAGFVTGERRTALSLRLARTHVELGNRSEALLQYRSLLAHDELPQAAFAEVEELASALGDDALLEQVIAQRVERAPDDRERVRALERLGEAPVKRDVAGAVDSFRRAAQASRQIEGERATAARLYERILELSPEDRESARFSFEAYAARNDFDRALSA